MIPRAQPPFQTRISSTSIFNNSSSWFSDPVGPRLSHSVPN